MRKLCTSDSDFDEGNLIKSHYCNVCFTYSVKISLYWDGRPETAALFSSGSTKESFKI